MSFRFRLPPTRNVAVPFRRRTGVVTAVPVGETVAVGVEGRGVAEGLGAGWAPEAHPESTSAIAAPVAPIAALLDLRSMIGAS